MNNVNKHIRYSALLCATVLASLSMETSAFAIGNLMDDVSDIPPASKDEVMMPTHNASGKKLTRVQQEHIALLARDQAARAGASTAAPRAASPTRTGAARAAFEAAVTAANAPRAASRAPSPGRTGAARAAFEAAARGGNAHN